jgi:hypothetical protein
MLSGHEHTPDVYSKHRSLEDIVHCVETDALWEPAARTSAFNLLLFDFSADTHSVLSFHWHEGTYMPRTIRAPGPFEHNASARAGVIENSQRFREKLTELGTGFSHRHSLRDLSLTDLFIYPDLVKRLDEVRTAPTPKMRIRSGAVADFMWEHRHVLVIGEGKSGKTSLARMLYSDSQRRGVVPLLIRGSERDPIHRAG